MKRTISVSTLCVALAASHVGVQAQGLEHDIPSPTVRMATLTEPVVIDGFLSEAVWGSAAPATNFIQQNPIEGEPATQRTEVRFALDEEALYIGARMFDSLGQAGVQTRLERRDQISGGDRIELVLDTFHDHAGRTVFWVNPSGVKFDAGQAAPNADSSWDPVWSTATQVDSLGWSAELRIPLSQLRFPRDAEQVWGLQIWRYVERLNEISMWSFWGEDETGGPTRFGHLTGIIAPRHTGGIEVQPYTTARAKYRLPTQPGSPFQSDSEYAMLAGGDVKALLTSTLTLDGTINPDFGQVEVDPAVVNLSAFETFLPEKRPFFIEGSGLFGYGGGGCFFCSNFSSTSLFYSRRIGRRPQGYLTFPTRYVEVPENSRILGAAKVTGRTAGGLQVGLLNAVTASESARVLTADGETMEREVEPLTNYLVGRIRRTSHEGNLIMGAIATSVLRRFDYDPISLILPSRASALGVDWAARFDEQYAFTGNFAMSEVGGDPAVIERLQNSSARYFNRPDRVQGSNSLFSDRYDPTLENLRGFGGFARLAKEGGDFQWEGALNVRSPGFEVNDMAFLTSADYVWMNANIARNWSETTRYYRRLNILAGGQQQYNFDRDLTYREARISAFMQATNYWNGGIFVIYLPEVYDDRMTRGGPVTRRASRWIYSANMATDSRRTISLFTNPRYEQDAEGMTGYQVNLNANIRPASNVTLSVGPRYSRYRNTTQFVQRFNDVSLDQFYDQRIVFADLVQHNLSMDTRIAVTFTPVLTLEVFAQPLVASGKYSDFKEFDAPRTLAKTSYDGSQLTAVSSATEAVASYSLDPDRNPATPNFTFDNPDFNLRSLRGNAVLRWEYRPGSTLFLVWQQSRSGTEPFGDMVMSRDLGAIFDKRPDNVFMVKATYWWGK